MSIIARLGVWLGINTSEFVKGLDDATKKTREFEKNQKQAIKNAQKAQEEFTGIAAKGLAGVAAAALAVGKAFQYADQIEDTAAAYDVTTSSLIAMQAAMQGAGGDADNVGTALNKLASVQQDAIEGSDELRKAFTELKISGKDVENLKLEDLFKRVVQELAQVEDAGKRAALQNQILGKAMKGVDASTFVNKYKEMGDPTLLSAIQENAKAWENIEAAFKNILFFAQKLVSPLAAIVNSIANIADTMQNLKEGGSAEIDWGAGELGGMPGTAITHGYGASPQRQNKAAIQIAKDAIAGDYKNLSKKGQSDAKAAAEEAKRIKEMRDALQLEIKLIKEKADIANKMFAVDSKGIVLGEAAISQEKMLLDLASDLAQIRSDAAKERSKDKAQIDLINAKEAATIDARTKRFAIENGLRQQRISREHDLAIENLKFEYNKTREIKELEFNSEMSLLALQKEKFEIGNHAYELNKIQIEKTSELAKVNLEFKQTLESINLEYDRSGKTKEDQAIKLKKIRFAEKELADAETKINDIHIAQRNVLVEHREREHTIAMQALHDEAASQKAYLTIQAANEYALLDLEKEKFNIGYAAYELEKVTLDANQQIKQINFETNEKLKEINKEYELSGKTIQDVQVQSAKIAALQSVQEEKIKNVIGLENAKKTVLEQQFALEDKMFKLDLAQQKGRDIANIQSAANVEKQRLQLESSRYLLSTNQYNLSVLALENINRLAEAEKKYNDQMKEAEYEMQRQGGGQRAREQYEQRIKTITEVRDIELEAIDQINNARQRNLETEIERQKSFVDGWSYAAKRFREDAENAFSRGERAFESVMSNMDSAISNFVETGKFEFQDFALSIIKDLIRMEMQAQATMLFRMLIGSFAPTPVTTMNYDAGVGTSIGMAASGGYIDSPTIVGENGAELFVPNTPGTVIPNGSWQQAAAGMNKSGFTNNGTYIASMNAIDTQSAEQFLAKNKNTIWAAYQSANRSVPISR